MLNHDVLWRIQGKKHYLRVAIVEEITADRKNIVMNVLLVTMAICQSIFKAFYAILVCTYGVINFYMINFIWIYSTVAFENGS